MKALLVSLMFLPWLIHSDPHCVCAGDDKPNVETSPLDTMKKLEGTWVELDENGEETGKNVTYRVTAGGSAVLETLFPGQAHEMLTVYIMDGQDLVLTHYCSLGNQPRMKAKRDTAKNELVFECTGVGGCESHDEKHMHSAHFEFVDNDHFKAVWNAYENGEKVYVATFDMTRKK